MWWLAALLEGLRQEEPVFDGRDGVHQRPSTPTGVHDVDVAVRADGSHLPLGEYQNTALVNSAQLACCMPLLYLCKVINNFILDFNFEGGYMYTILILPY